MTICDRPQYLEPVLASWQNVASAAEVDWWFMIEPTPVQDECWFLVNRFRQRIGLPSDRYTIWPNERRLGVLENPYRGLKLAFGAGAEYVVLAEDDVLVSRDVLAYHAWAADRFAPDSPEPAMAVCSHRLAERGGPYDVTWSDRFDPLVWGTWRGRWQAVIEPSWDHDYSTGPGGGVEAGWDWNLNRMIPETGFQVLKPAQSRSMHIGQHGGTHCTPEMYPSTASSCFAAEREPGEYRHIGVPTID